MTAGEMGGDTRLRRDIGFFGSAFLAFNGIVGAGIFALPGTLYERFGTLSPWLFPIFGVLVLLVALPLARLAALVPASGGPVAYTAPLGRFASFQTGWLYYVARVAAMAANANVFATYAGTLWAPLGTSVGRAATIAALAAALTFVNVVGVRRAIRLLDGLTLLKAAPLVALSAWALALYADGVPAPGSPPPMGEVEGAALLILYAFIGFENSLVPAGETQRPDRTIPRALLATIAGTAGLYFLVQLAYVAVMRPGAAVDAPLVQFAEVLLGPVGALIITAAALASVAGNISGSMTSTPRVTYALAEDGVLPGWFGRVSDRWATPANSVLFMGVLGAVLAISGSFVWLAVVSTLARLFVFAASFAALPMTERATRAELRWSTAAMVGGGMALCLWAAFQSDAVAWRMLAVLVAVGLGLYVVARRAASRADQAGMSSAGTVASIQPPPSTRSSE